MFLNTLDATEKEAFLDLATACAKSDGAIAQAESDLLNAYRREMETSYVSTGGNTEVALSLLAKSEHSAKKAVYLELLALVDSDGIQHGEEATFLDSVAIKLDVSEEDKESAFLVLASLNAAFSKARDFVGR